jgi:hypothetical protein
MRPKLRGSVADGILIAVLSVLGAVIFLLSPWGATERLSSKAPSVIVPTVVPQLGDAGPTSPIEGPTAILLPTLKPNEQGVPTPFPTVFLPPMTPVPTSSGLPPTRTPPAITPPSMPQPSDPFNLTVAAARFPNTRVSVNEATRIIIGTVKEILPARWSTADGQRPPNPHVEGLADVIYRPVVFEVEQYYKGKGNEQELVLVGFGGTVGQDSMEYAGDDLFTFHVGERMIVFLKESQYTLNGRPLATVVERYTITTDKQAKNELRGVPHQLLLDEINAAIASEVRPTVSP